MNPSDKKKILRWVIALVVAYLLSLWLKGKEVGALMTTVIGGAGGSVASAVLVP
jgi:hypothetical protein